MIFPSYDKILISIFHLLNYLGVLVISCAFEYNTLTCRLYEVHCTVPVSSVSTTLQWGMCVSKHTNLAYYSSAYMLSLYIIY